jgi:two-component system, NtrC family, response regulator AtoC
MAMILIIDDDNSICETLELYLSEEGYDVVIANTGKQGIYKYTKNSIDLIILDVRLPDMDGFSVLSEMKKYDKHVNVVMISAFHDIASVSKAKRMGAFDYIRKPINLIELESAISCAMEIGS